MTPRAMTPRPEGRGAVPRCGSAARARTAPGHPHPHALPEILDPPQLPERPLQRLRLDDLDGNAGIILAELLEQIGQQDEGQAHADGELAVFAALQGSDLVHGAL